MIRILNSVRIVPHVAVLRKAQLAWRPQLWWVVGILGFVCLFLLWVVFGCYTYSNVIWRLRLEAEAHVVELEARKEHIKDKVEYLGSERGMEAQCVTTLPTANLANR